MIGLGGVLEGGGRKVVVGGGVGGVMLAKVCW